MTWIAVLLVASTPYVPFSDSPNDQTLERRYREAIRFLEARPPSAGLTDYLNALGGLYYRQMQYERAEQMSRRALEVERSLEHPRRAEIARSLANIGSALADRGKCGQALEFLRDAIATSDSNTDPEVIGSAHNALGVIALRGHRAADAVAEFELARKSWRGDASREAVLAGNLARARSASGQHEASLAAFHEAIGLARNATLGDQVYGSLLCAYSRELWRAGRKQDAEEWKREAKAILAAVPAASVGTVDVKELHR